MSAFVVSKSHIDALVTAGLWLPIPNGPLRWFHPEIDPTRSYHEQAGNQRQLTRETTGRVGAMLWAENMYSFNARYKEEGWEEPYVFAELPGTPDPVAVLKMISCYEYQSCEHVEWRRSEAHQFCDALRLAAIRRLPGYDEAPWEAKSPAAFLNAQIRRRPTN